MSKKLHPFCTCISIGALQNKHTDRYQPITIGALMVKVWLYSVEYTCTMLFSYSP